MNSFFLTMQFRISRSLFTNFFFLRMEFRLSRSLFTNFLFSHDGIQAITKPFHKLCFFSRWNSGYHKAFFTNFFFLTMEFLKTHDLGESSFHIYHKEYLHRIRSLKTMPLDLGPPLQGKEYGPSYSNLNARSKCFCFRNHL
jgi:hypothetical protein